MDMDNNSQNEDFDCFRTIHCMNLKSNIERWENTIREVEKLGPTYRLIRYDAIRNKENPKLGHSETFKGMIYMAKQKKLEAILIGEDDLVLCDESRDAWESGLSELPDNWDVLLGGIYYVRGRQEISPHLCQITDFCATHFILIRNTVYDKILEFPNTNYGFKNIDRYIGKLAALGQLNAYVVWPMVSSQRAGYSDLRKRKVDDNRNNKRKGLDFLTEKDDN